MPTILNVKCNVCGGIFTGENAFEKARICERKPIPEQRFKKGDIIATVSENGKVEINMLKQEPRLISDHRWLYDNYSFGDHSFKIPVHCIKGEAVVKRAEIEDILSNEIIRNTIDRFCTELIDNSYYYDIDFVK